MKQQLSDSARLSSGQCHHTHGSTVTRRGREYFVCHYCKRWIALNPTRVKAHKEPYGRALLYVDDYKAGRSIRETATLRGCSKNTVLKAFQTLDMVYEKQGLPSRPRKAPWWLLKIRELERQIDVLKEQIKLYAD